MARLVVDNLEEEVRDKLQDLARSHGRSMDDEIRDILRGAVMNQLDIESNLGTRLASRFSGRGLDQEIPELRGQPIRPPSFET